MFIKLPTSNSSQFNFTAAIELANLIERAYQQFEYHQLRLQALQQGKNIPTWVDKQQRQLTGSTVVKPELADKLNKIHELDNPQNPGKVTYKIRATFNYTGYWVGKPGKVPFGFIVQRELVNGIPGIFVVFRGTRSEPEWFSDLQYEQVPFLGNPLLGQVSRGFNKIYTRPNDDEVRQIQKTWPQDAIFTGSIRDTIIDTLSTCPANSQIFVTGHSLGGALATLATLDIFQKTQFKTPILYTFASPRVGNPLFAAFFEQLSCFRVANSEDVVPTVPPASSRLIGDEMLDGLTPARRSTLEFLLKISRNVADTFLNTECIYQHIGESLYFTAQKGSISYNHNMFFTYREALSVSV